MKLTRNGKLAVAVATAITLSITSVANAKGTTLNVGGASSVASVIGQCKTAYSAANDGDSFSYASTGSGQGLKDMETGKNDFSFSDSPHVKSQSGSPIPANEIHVPTFVFPIGVLYKDFLGGKKLALSTSTVAGIFAGKITMWNDPAIVKDNTKSYTVQVFKKDKKGKPLKDKKGKPILAGTKQVTQSLKLPEKMITVIYRGDSSGTTGNFLAALGQMDKPDVDFMEGLSPAVSIDQKSTNRNPRSTVGTITEVYDYLRLLFARAGKPHCPKCGSEITRQTPQNIVDQILAMPEGTKFQVLAPVIRERKGEFLDLFKEFNVPFEVIFKDLIYM